MTDHLKAPFPWFGGKSRVAAEVWAALGAVAHYAEPFFGSGAVLLGRPTPPQTETVNDLDGYIANFWRAIQADPEAVAKWADWPVNEIDLLARHRWLCKMPEKTEFLARMQADPDYYDAKRAGWWVWGICAWIGAGWCGGEWWPEAPSKSVWAQRPYLSDSGRGVHSSRGRGINNLKRPHLGNSGMGVHQQHSGLTEWFDALADRLRHVRVCCGDWSRIVTKGALAHGSTVGVFLDPPYDQAERHDCYVTDSAGLSAKVRDWCLANGDNPRYRIALCGFDGEHDLPGWRVHAWKSQGGYGNQGNSRGRANRGRERIWFSPHCLGGEQPGLFESSSNP